MTWRNRRGFALPLVIFVLTLVTIMLATIFVRVQVDRRIAESSGDVLNAQVAASSGLNRYFAHYDSLGTRPPDGDSLRINVIGGYADVVAHVFQRPADSTVGMTYVVRSRGRVIKPTQGADPQAVSTIAQFAQWQYGSMKLHGALTAINDFVCNTGDCDGTYSLIGYDECGMKPPLVAGLRTPNGPTSKFGPPEVDPQTIEGPAAASFADRSYLGVDWAHVTGGAFVPDYTSLTDLSSWSVYLISGDLTVSDLAGNGLLMVTGNLRTTGQYLNWQGIVLVGGAMIFEADTTYVRGTVVTGINYQIGTAPPVGRWGPDSTHIDIRYNSCYVRNSLVSYTGFAPIGNARISTWKTY